jgi:hypothetical protein
MIKHGLILYMLALVSYGHAQQKSANNTINNQLNTNKMENEAKKVVTEF